ncbi:WHG domain-containing protein [Streptomyces cellulosae]|uniref:WHG domain-containing protein n=1 Tax=Streptomyces cellulosae TaxID=1968 RepID=UPI00068C8A98|nr:WHG domain-containing protein [Streptomyces cellulosae]
MIADAQQRGEIVEDDPERLTLLVGATVHGLASYTANGMLDAPIARGLIGDAIHPLLHGLAPR